ncbi:retrovirus-related pol polyprotein from transposon TNT 1-94 [Tanacetum coccineum]
MVKLFRQSFQTMLLFRPRIIDTYDSDCDDISNAKAVLMANISNYGFDAIQEWKAQRIKPTLYDGIMISNKHVAMPVIDDDETLILEENSRSKLSEKTKDPEVINKNISYKPIDYEKLNRLFEDFRKRFTPHQEMDAEQAFWFRISNSTIESSNLSHVKVKFQWELPSAKKVAVSTQNKARIEHSLLNANSEPICATCKKSMFDGVHDKCLLDFVENVNSRAKSAKKYKKQNIWKPTGHVFTEVGLKWKPTGRTFTIVGKSCPLTRITSTNVVPPKKPTSYSIETHKPELNVYSRKSKNVKNVGCPDCTVRFGKDNIVRIIGYGDYQLENVTISRVYYVEGLGHNLFPVGQFCDADIKVAFQKNTFFIRNLEGVDLISESRDINLYTISLDDMLKTSLICLLSKASKSKSWLWHRHLSHLNFGTLNKLTKDDLAQGIPRLKFQKDHLCSTCALVKSKKSSHQPKAEDINQEKLYLLHMDLCGPMSVASINGKSSGPGLHFMTPTTSSSGLVPNTISQQPCIPPTRDDWDHLFQPMFDEYFNPSSIVISPVQEADASRVVFLAESLVSTSIDQDTPSTSIPSTQEQEHSPNISQGFEELPKTPTFRDDPLHESLHEDSTS